MESTIATGRKTIADLRHDLHALGYLLYSVHGQKRWCAVLIHDGKRTHTYATAPLTRSKVERFFMDAKRDAADSWLIKKAIVAIA